MKSVGTYRALVLLFVSLFLAVQSYAVAYAPVHDCEHPDHEAVSCVVVTITQDDIAVLPTDKGFHYGRVHYVSDERDGFLSAFILSPQGRAPPPRSPPVSIPT